MGKNLESATAKRTHRDFTLVLEGVHELDGRVMDALHDAGVDNATVSLRDGVVRLVFVADVDNYSDSFVDAVEGIRRAGFVPATENGHTVSIHRDPKTDDAWIHFAEPERG